MTPRYDSRSASGGGTRRGQILAVSVSALFCATAYADRMDFLKAVQDRYVNARDVERARRSAVPAHQDRVEGTGAQVPSTPARSPRPPVVDQPPVPVPGVTRPTQRSGASSVVLTFLTRVARRGDVAELLTSESRSSLRDMLGGDISDSPFAASLRQYSGWRVESERSEPNGAVWVTVKFQTDDPVKAALAAKEAEIAQKNAYNRAQGNEELIRLNEQYLAQQKQMLQSPEARQLVQALPLVDVFLCLKEGGAWKVAFVEGRQKMMEKMLDGLEKAFEETGTK